MLFADLGDIRVHYRLDGPEDGPALVFANALGTDFRIWDGVVAHLPAGLRILRYDMRGHGLTTATEGPYYMGDLVADAAGLMESVGMKDAVFVGLSIGGVVAQGLAAERLDLLRAIVLSNTAAKIGTPDSWARRIATVRAEGIAAIAEGILGLWFSKKFHETRAEELAGWRHMLTRTPVAGYTGCCAAMAETDLRDSTARLALPTLVLAGSEDGSTPPDLVRETAESIAGARFEVIRGAGHIPCVETPETMTALIAAFLEENAIV